MPWSSFSARPDSSILSGLTSVNLSMLSTKAIAAGTVATKPDGTGPYRLLQLEPQQLPDPERQPALLGWQGEAGVREDRDDPHRAARSPRRSRRTPSSWACSQSRRVAKTLTGYKVQKVLDLSYRALMLQDRTGPLANVNNRRALECAINREQVVADSVFGTGPGRGADPRRAVRLESRLRGVPHHEPCGGQELSRGGR